MGFFVCRMVVDLDMKKYYVYVIELEEKVTNHKKFRQKNPKYIKGNGCVYVGQSARKPEIRFEQHKKVIKQIISPNYMG